MRTQALALASFSGLRIGIAMSCGVVQTRLVSGVAVAVAMV